MSLIPTLIFIAAVVVALLAMVHAIATYEPRGRKRRRTR
jgi:hypothetical protein